jgi:dolichyl-phosphate beta-glucosyltransferase
VNDPHLSLILPAYNEAQRIESTLDAVQTYLGRQPYSHEIIVAADGDDGTRERAAQRARLDGRVRVLGDVARRGKGRGIREAVAIARGRFIGFADADYKTPIEEIEHIWPWFDRGYDLVIGSRAIEGSRIEVQQPLYRRLGSRGFGRVLRVVVGLRSIVDTQCGFKFFRGEAAHDLFERQRIDGYMFDIEILWLAEHLGYRIRQVGVRWRDDRDSRLQLVVGNWQNLRDLFRIRFHAIERRLHRVHDTTVSTVDR